MKKLNTIKVLFVLEKKRIGFSCSLGRHLRYCYLSCILAFRVLLGSEREGNQYQFLSLEGSLLLRGILSWLRGCLLYWLLLFLYSTDLTSLFERDSGGQKGNVGGILVGLKSFGSSLGLGAREACYLES